MSWCFNGVDYVDLNTELSIINYEELGIVALFMTRMTSLISALSRSISPFKYFANERLA